MHGKLGACQLMCVCVCVGGKERVEVGAAVAGGVGRRGLEGLGGENQLSGR